MSVRDLSRRLAARPAWGCAAVAVVLRTALVLHAWTSNPLVRAPVLDGVYYLQWAREIAAGDVAGRSGLAAGEPWLLNPLYAYLLAPFVPAEGVSHLPILVGQALLGAATAGLAAAAATRTFGRAAGWIAGLLVAFSAPLAEMDAHVAVTSLATFLIAGACFACAPAVPTDRRWAHGPAAAALWLGIGALARPVTVIALPFVAWRFARESPKRLRTLAVAAAVFGACAVPSLVRNWAVSGEPVVWTASGGINAYLGNNPDARKYGQFVSGWIRFDPVRMHQDARRIVAGAAGGAPTRSEISTWFTEAALHELGREPGASAVHYANKARWFFGPTEVPSSASLSVDRQSAPWLHAAFVPTFVLAGLAAAGLWAHRRRREVLLGPGAIVLAHLVVLTVLFPLSHYRAPGVPAMAILAAGAVTAVLDRSRGRARWIVLAVAGGFAVVGALPPQPDPLTTRDEMLLATMAMREGRLIQAEDHARRAIDAVPQVDPGGSCSAEAFQTLGEVFVMQRRWPEALGELNDAIAHDLTEPNSRLLRSWVFENLGNLGAAEAETREVVETHPANPDAWERLGDVLWHDPARRDEAERCHREFERLGGRRAEVLKRLGVPRRPAGGVGYNG